MDCLNCGWTATHAFCDGNANSTDEYGNSLTIIDHVYCKACAYELVRAGKGELCYICENNESTMVEVEGEEFKPIYVPGTLNSKGMCKDHP